MSMKIAYIRTRRPPAKKATPDKDWMELRHIKRLADKNTDRLKALGVTKEEYIKMMLDGSD